jgi:uncharacterized membrane protein
MDLVVRTNTVWMTVNLLLAALPFILALVLFVPGRPRTVAWWLGLGTFVVFLPNAPYVLTDIIHLSGQIRRTGSTLHAGLLVAEYAAFMAVGLALYGGCLFLLRRRLQAEGFERWRWPAELALHALCSVGIFLGRVLRLNSWDVVANPGRVLQYAGIPKATTIVLIGCTFVVLIVATLALRVPLAIHDLRRASR